MPTTAIRIRENFFLESYTEADESDFLRLFGDPRVLEHSSSNVDPVISQSLFNQILAWQQTPPQKAFHIWKATLEGKMIGHAELKWTKSCEDDELEIVYFLFPEHWGKGYATEICSALVEYAHSELGASAVIATLDPDHPASVRVLEKSGFTQKQQLEDELGTFLFFRAPAPTATSKGA